MRPMLVALALVTLATSGCSFRHPGQLYGAISTLSASPFGAMSPNTAITVTAQAAFSGSFQEPTLSVILQRESPQTIRVEAIAQWDQPFLGLGIFNTPATSIKTVELKTTITLARAGRYTLESIPPEGGTAVRTTLDIE